MGHAPHHRPTRTRRLAAGWLAAACLFLAAQLAVAFHDHGAGEAPSRDRAAQCGLCLAQGTPAAPAPAATPGPVIAGATPVEKSIERPVPLARTARTAHAPRAPPALRPA